MQQESRIPIVLDAGPAVHQSAGLSRYTEELIRHLSKDERLDLSLFYNSHSGHKLPYTLSEVPKQTRKLGQLPWRLGVLLSQLVRRPIFQQDIFPPSFQPLHQPSHPSASHQDTVAIYHATEHLLPCLPLPTVLTVHDLIFERYPQHHTLRNRLYLRLAMPLFVRRATQIIAVSTYTKNDLVELYGTPEEKITVIYEGVDQRFQPASALEIERIKARYSPGHPYLLMVGTLEPRKNHIAAIKAMLHLRNAGLPHKLLIAGGKGWLFDPIQAQVKQMELENDVIFAGFVPDDDLPALYSGATCVLVPSLYEGFGFSVAEAMACGTPVISSKVSSLREIGGDAAMLLDKPEDDEELAAQIRIVIEEPDVTKALSAMGRKQVDRFRWDTTAKETADLYQSIHNRWI
ncbi:MAG: glycosyltransferase family 1 protein [Chloroflexota bacterium]